MEFLLDALIDSLKLLPFLFVAYVLIEVIEYFSASKIEHSKLLVGKYSTLFGAGFSLIPQCGFSVVATDLYAEKRLKIGTLLAIYIATSDEAIPILLMYPGKMIALLPLLLIKFLLAIIIGYTVDLIFKSFNQKRLSEGLNKTAAKAEEKNKPVTASEENEQVVASEENGQVEASETAETEHHIGCCGHDIEEHKGSKVKQFLVHPLIHTLKIFLFILIVNIAFSGLVELVTEEKLMAFLSKAGVFAPLIAVLIGLIPNCVSSVIITKLYIFGGISFGACLAGLIVNAGIAFVVLFKQNKSIKENFAIVSSMLMISIVTGYIVQLIGF